MVPERSPRAWFVELDDLQSSTVQTLVLSISLDDETEASVPEHDEIFELEPSLGKHVRTGEQHLVRVFGNTTIEALDDAVQARIVCVESATVSARLN